MQPSDSPFLCHWWGISLDNVGLGDVRPDVGTYGRYAFDALPPLPFTLRGDFAWLDSAPVHDYGIGDEKAVDTVQALLSLRTAAHRFNLRLPDEFTTFMAKPALHSRIRSNTDCFLDLCPQLIPAPLDSGFLIRFLADSQSCIFWYIYLLADGADHAFVASPDFYGTPAEQWSEESPNPNDIVFCAESFEMFLCRFWLENEIWFAAREKRPLSAVGQAYIERYRDRK